MAAKQFVGHFVCHVRLAVQGGSTIARAACQIASVRSLSVRGSACSTCASLEAAMLKVVAGFLLVMQLALQVRVSESDVSARVHAR
jgi:hypothetical protein